MTILKRFLAMPSDVLALRMECQHCKASLSIPFDEAQRVPERCTNPSCQKRDWFFQDSLEEASLNTFIKAMHAMREGAKKNGRYNVQFEFEQPST